MAFHVLSIQLQSLPPINVGGFIDLIIGYDIFTNLELSHF